MTIFNLGKRKNFVEDNMRYIIQILTGLMASQSTIESQCLLPYDETKTYAKGQICLYNNYLYLCKTTTTGVFEETKWEKQADNITELDLDTIKTFLGLTPEQLETMTNLISTEIRLDKVFSSSETYTRIDGALKEAKQYCISQLAKKSTGSFKIATGVAEVTDGNYLYLIMNTATSKYDIYALVDGTVEKLTTVEVNLDNYLTKNEIEADFLKKADADGKYATITNVNDKVNKTSILTTIDSSATDEQVYSASVINTELGNKVNKTSIIDNLTSTDMDKPLSANQGKALYDKIEELRLTGAVQNLYPSTYYNNTKYISNGVTSVINNDGSITFNGTATGTHFCVIFHRNYNGLGQAVRLRGKTITMSGGAASPVLSLAFYDEEGNNVTPPDNAMVYDTGKGVTLTVPDNAYSIYSYYYISGGTYKNTTLYPMLEEGNVAHSFVTPKKTNLTKENLVTAIDSSSTDNQIPSALSIINKMSNSINSEYAKSDTMNVNFNKTGWYKFNSPTKGVPENNVGDYVLLNIPWNNCYPNTGQFAIQFLFSPRFKGFWFRRIWDYKSDYVYTEGNYDVFTKWKSIGYIEHAPKVIVFNDTTKYEQNAESNLRYTISNGICHVTGGINCISPASGLTVVCDNMPKASLSVYAIGLNIKGAEDNDPVKIYIESTNLNLRGGIAGNDYRFTFSYPINDH